MRKIVLASAVALTVAAPLAIGRAAAQPYMPPGAAPPWGVSIPATTTPAAAPAAPPSAAAASGTTTPTHAVFLHASPNGGSPVLTTLHPGEPLRVLASAPGGWMQVEQAAGGSGWAFGSYLAHSSAPPAGPPQDTDPQ